MKLVKRSLSALLALALCVELLPASVFAFRAEKPQQFTTSSGESVSVEESWESVYPYGVFLFTDSQADLTEGGGALSVKVYRMGGTRGRATAYLNYAPVVMPVDDETMSYGSAAGRNDVSIETEDPLPIARYQPLGKDPDPERGALTVSDAPYTGKDGLAGDRVLTLGGDAEARQWQIFADGCWQDVEDAVGAEFLVSEELYTKHDFRCVYTLSGVRYCTDSLKGEVYRKGEPEELPPVPEGIDLHPAQSFTAVESASDDPYAGVLFPLTFADGEWVKEVRFTAPQDEIAEAMKFGVLTIVDCEGGAVYESATVLTVSVTDDEPAEPFTVGFTAERFEADRTDGVARLTLKRVGGGQNVIAVAWSTADGTAKAGADYTASSGEAIFYADIDRAVIEVPLIDAPVSTDGAPEFTVRLGEIRGDGEGLGALACAEATVALTGAGSGKGKNLASMLYAPEAMDVSGNVTWGAAPAAPVNDAVVTGDEADVPEEKLLQGTISGYDAVSAAEGRLMTFDYGRVTFRNSYGGSYWTGTASVAGSQKNDLTGWSAGSGYGNGWQFVGDDQGRAWLPVAYMPQMYSSFDGRLEFCAGLDNGWHFTNGYVYGWGGVYNKDQSAYQKKDCNPKLTTSYLVQRTLTYNTSGSLNASWGMDAKVGYLVLGLDKVENKSKNNVYSRLVSGSLTRRNLNHDLYLRIHTANDGESGGANVVTAPDGGAALKVDSGVYESIKPEVTVVPGAGGVDSRGRLYVGSQLKVSLRRTDSYKPLESEILSSAVYVTRSNGQIVSKVKVDTKGQDSFVTLVWDGMTPEDLNDTYTINVVMTRVQKLELDLTPSVPRRTDGEGNPTAEIDSARIGEAWQTFRESSAMKGITLGYTAVTASAPHFGEVKTKTISLSEWNNGSKPELSLGSAENLQYVNFNRSEVDRIIFNGRSYKGNENIWLTVEDLAYGTLSFKYYAAAYLSAESIMNASVLRAELYLDKDGDRIISGHYDRNTGYFLPDAGKDEFVMMLEAGESYDEVLFQPELQDDGKTYAEYYLKIYYTMSPRALENVTGSASVAQVLPALTTSITDPARYALLTEAQQSYRYVIPGVGADGAFTSDGHPMYGAEASQVSFVDVPLGGDRSPVVASGDENTGYTFSWDPHYEGSLIYPFNDPEPIYIEHSLAGDNYPLAEITLDRASGSVRMDAKGKDNLNGYLGSFVADTTIALCVAEQRYPVSRLMRDAETAQTLQPESSTLIDRSAEPDASYLSLMEAPSMGEAKMDPSEGDQPYQEMQPDFGLGMDMISTTAGALGYATLVTKKDEIIISISLPILTSVSKNGGEAKKSRFPQTISKPMEKKLDELSEFMNTIGNGGDSTKLENMFKDHDFKGLKGGGMSSRNKSYALNVSLMITFKYDSTINAYYFKEFGGGFVGSFSYKYTYRLAVCPIVYVYVSVGLSAAVTTSGVFKRSEKERETPMVSTNEPVALHKGESYQFSTPYRNMNIQFQGKVFIELFDSKDAAAPTAGSNGGYLQSAGGKKITVRMDKGVGMEFPSGASKFVRITALEDTTLQYVNVIEDVKSELIWSGVKVAPKLTLELGAGAGVDFMKVEACVKMVVSLNILFGQPNKEGDRDFFVFDSARFSASIFLRAVFLSYSEEIEAIGIAVTYKDGKGWGWSWTHMGKEEAQLFGEEDGSTLHLPADTTRTQRIYSPAAAKHASLMAYEPDDPDVPFQLSGYNRSVNAVKLADGLDLGNDFQIISVGKTNYLLYTVGRKNPASPAHSTMLVLSRVVPTGGSAGLVNPADEKSAIPYIPVDVISDGSQTDDGTGDLDFKAVADGRSIRVAWVSYERGAKPPKGASTREMFQWSAQNTVVKYADFDTTAASGFTAAKVIGEGDANLFMPAYLGVTSPYKQDIVAYFETTHLTAQERAAAVADYRAALKSVGLDPDGTDEKLAVQKRMGQYRLSSQEDLLDARGKQNALCVALTDEPTAKLLLPEGQIVDNVAVTRTVSLRDRMLHHYVAYTTRETVFTDAAGSRVESGAECANILTIRRLYLAAFLTRNGEVEWENGGTPVLLQTLYDYEKNDALTDGVYAGGGITAYEDPYFANLKFLNAVLGDTLSDNGYVMKDQEETFLLFEMNGSTYVVRNESLEGFLGSQHTGSVLPFFASEDGSATGRTEVTIGADGAGGLAAVYVGTAEGSTNNALYLSKYDYVTESWSKGVMLAMAHMDVYEDAVAEGWSPEETEKAFLGKREGYGKGGMDQFVFSAPQIALGVREVPPSGDAAEQQANDDHHTETTLLVLARGSMRYLKDESMRDGDGNEVPIVVVDEDGKGAYPKGIGAYVISYGVGQQTLGEGYLRFVNCDFSAGAQLNAAVGFTNTGDVSVRGSSDRDQAITVTLNVQGEGISDTPLQSWTITENILPGQRVQLNGEFELPMTLPEGASFHLTVSEGDYYVQSGGKPYSTTLRDLFTVEKRPELGFEYAAFDLNGADGGVTVDESGNAVLNADFMVGNRGNADARNVYVQFLRDTGAVTEDGAAVYAPLDLTGSSLTVGEEEELLTLMAERTNSDLRKGILYLGGIRQGRGRRISGTFTVHPGTGFCLSGAELGLRLEIFSAADEPVTETDGVHTAVHGEYNGVNNVCKQRLAAATDFFSADHLLLSKGTLMRLPIRYVSVCVPEKPEIQVTELPDNEIGDGKQTTRFRLMDQNLDLAYFEEGSFSDGRGQGTLVLRAAEEGNGYVRIMDMRTNSYRDIAFTVVEAAAGMDVFPNNGRFRFYNANGSEYKQSGADWAFASEVDFWGDRPAEPFMRTLAKAKTGASFTFETVAEAIDLSMMGGATVQSTFPGFQTVSVEAAGGSGDYDGETAFVYFGSNPQRRAHTVTITVTKVAAGVDNYASFDRITEHYSGDLHLGAEQGTDMGPQFYWLSNYPTTSFTYSGIHALIRVSVFGSQPLHLVTASDNAEVYHVQKITPNWWNVTLRLRGSGAVTVSAVDQNSNVGITTLDLEEKTERLLGGRASLMEEDDEAYLNTGEWMQVELLEQDDRRIRVTLDPSVAMKGMITLLLYLGADELEAMEADDSDIGRESIVNADLTTEHVQEFSVSKEGLYAVATYILLQEGDDPAYDYQILAQDGTVLSEGNAKNRYAWNVEFLMTKGAEMPTNIGGILEQRSASRSGGSAVGAAKTVELPNASEQSNGAVTASTVNAKAGSTVTLTMTPDTGYKAERVNVTDANGNAVAVVKNADGTYGFTMPSAAPVAVEPVFAPLKTPEIGQFTDLAPDGWYREPIDFCLKNGLMQGVSDTAFVPNATASRAMIVTMLWRFAGEQGGALSPFRDVPAGAWYALAVNWAAQSGALKGTTATTFTPNAPVTREQLAAILYRYAQSLGLGFTGAWSFPLKYSDADSISDYAYEAMCWMTANGVIKGMSDGSAAPGAYTTRAQTAAIFRRFSALLEARGVKG